MKTFVAKRVLFQMVYWKLYLLLDFIPKYSIFWKKLYSLVVPATWLFSSNKEYFLNCFFLLSLYDLMYFEQIMHKEFSSCMVVKGFNWCPSKLIVLAKDSFYKNFNFQIVLLRESRTDLKNFTKHDIDRAFDALQYGVFFVRIWSV